MARTSSTLLDPKRIATQNCDSVDAPNKLPAGIDPADCWIEAKLDGFRLVTVITEDGPVFLTRSLKRQDGKLPHLEEAFARLPVGTVLDGELVAWTEDDDGHIHGFGKVQSIMNSLPERAVKLQRERGWLRYVVFDMTFHGELDWRREPLEFRREGIEKLVDAVGSRQIAISGALASEHVITMDTRPCTVGDHVRLCEVGHEGSVIKLKSSTYVNDGRGKGWWKCKPKETADVVIIGYNEGEGKFLNMVGGIVFGVPLDMWPFETGPHADSVVGLGGLGDFVKRGSCSGMDDATRQYVSDNRQRLLGTVMEITHEGPGGGQNNTNFRFPQFFRFRTDKRADQVRWES